MIHQTGMVKVGTGATALELEMPGNRSAMITDIRYFVDGAAAEDIDISIDQKRIFQFIAPATWQLLSQGIDGTLSSIFEIIRRNGLFRGIPVGPGEKLSVTALAAEDYIEVEFDYADAGDFQPSMVNGSAAQMYQLFQVISNTDTVIAAGDWPLDQSDLDSLFPAFPGGAVVPANTRMHLRALFGGPTEVGETGDSSQRTSRLKMLHNREDILSHDLVGMMWLGDDALTSDTVSYLSNGSVCQIPVAGQDAKIKVFDPPVIFEPGSELNVFATVVEDATGGDATAGEIKLGMLFDVETLSV